MNFLKLFTIYHVSKIKDICAIWSLDPICIYLCSHLCTYLLMHFVWSKGNIPYNNFIFEVINIGFWQIWHFDVKDIEWLVLQPRDFRQITFMTLNRFCQLSKPPTSQEMDLDRIPTKIKWKIHALFITWYFTFWRYFL